MAMPTDLTEKVRYQFDCIFGAGFSSDVLETVLLAWIDGLTTAEKRMALNYAARLRRRADLIDRTISQKEMT